MGKFRALAILALSIAAVVAVCLTVYIVFSSLAARHSANPFNDSDLIPIRMEVPVESNAFWTLLKATNGLYWPDTLKYETIDLDDTTNWNERVMADMVEKNRQCLDLFGAAMKQRFFLVPEPRSFDEDDSYLTGWKAISRLEAIEAVASFREKREKDAFDSALKVIAFGARAGNSGGAIIHYLVGTGIKSIGLQLIRQMIPRTTLQGTNLIAVMDALDEFNANQQAFTNALRMEYHIDCNFIDNLAAGNISNSDQPVLPFRLNIIFNPAKTKMKFAQAVRVLQNNASKPYGEIPWSELPVVGTNASAWRQILSGNFIGDNLYEMLGPSWRSVAARKCRENVEITATQLLLALRVYKMRHGKLPESLSELVPEFFQHVPMDAFDGKPLRYLPEKRLVYSVGPDLKDSGGQASREDSDSYDLPFKIEF